MALLCSHILHFYLECRHIQKKERLMINNAYFVLPNFLFPRVNLYFCVKAWSWKGKITHFLQLYLWIVCLSIIFPSFFLLFLFFFILKLLFMKDHLESRFIRSGVQWAWTTTRPVVQFKAALRTLIKSANSMSPEWIFSSPFLLLLNRAISSLLRSSRRRQGYGYLHWFYGQPFWVQIPGTK